MSKEANAGSTLDILVRAPTTAAEMILAREVKRLRSELYTASKRETANRERLLSLVAEIESESAAARAVGDRLIGCSLSDAARMLAEAIAEPTP